MHRFLIITVAACAFMIACRAAEARPLVGVYYFPGWYRAAGNPAGESSEWRSAIMKAAVPRAMCGFYNDADPRLWGYYIPWMSTHGIDFLAFDWYYNAGQEFLYESLDRGFLQADKTNDVKFCVHWCNHGGPWWLKPLDQSKPAVLAMTDLLCARYFHRPNYLRIDGRPVFMIYEINQFLGFGGEDAAREALSAMRQRVREKGFPDVYLVAVYPGSSPDYLSMLKSLGFDASCAYTYCWMRPPSVEWDTEAVPYADLAPMIADCLYPTLERAGKKAGLPYWPSTFSGWDDRPRAGVEKAFLNLGNTPESFAVMLRGALDHVNPASPVVMVEAWNEWGEGACIEPSKQFGFGFLRAMADVLGKKSPNETLPSAEEIASWSVLTPDELKAAAENESKPWPLKEPKLYALGKSFDAPEVNMPFVIDLTRDGIPTDQIALDAISIKERTAEGTWFETTGGDPKIVFPEMQVPMAQIKRITVEGRMTRSGEGVGQRQMEVYWTTALMPGYCGFASASVSWPSEGSPSIEIADIMCWEKTGTPLTGLRIDPCPGPGARFLIRRVILSGE